MVGKLRWARSVRLDLVSVSVADVHHRFEDGVIGGLRFEHGIGEHATVPTNVLDAAFGGSFEPVPGAFNDVELAVGVVASVG